MTGNTGEGQQPTVVGEVRTAVELATSVAGLAGYVTLLGGLVTWVRLTTARLPGDTLTSIDDPTTMFVIGFKVLLFVALVFAGVSLLCYAAGGIGWGAHRHEWHAIVSKRGVRNAAKLETREQVELMRHEEVPLGERAVRTVAGFNVLVIAALIGLSVARIVELVVPTQWIIITVFFVATTAAVWLLANWGPMHLRSHVIGLAFAALVIFFAEAPIGVLIVAGLAIAGLGRVIARLERPTSATGFLRSPLLWALLVVYVLAGLAYEAQPPVTFTRAVLETTDGTQIGGYLTRTSDGVYLITCQGLADATSRNERTVLIPSADIKSTTLGGEPVSLDSGDRPSIATIVFRALGIHAHPPTWFRVELRTQRATCSGELPTATPDKALGAGVLTGPAPLGGRASGGEAPVDVTSPGIAALALKYQPTVETTVADRFWPVSVASVLKDRGGFVYGLLHGGQRNTCLVRAGTCSVSSPTLANLNPAGASPTDYLNYPADLGHGDPTAQFEAFLRGQGQPVPTGSDWLANPASLDPWRSAQVYFYDAGVGKYGTRYPGAPPGLRSLQYWFFYPYNYYPTVVAPQLMPTSPIAADLANTDLHEGDWEHVAVLLDPQTLQPRYVYLARHDSEGVTLPWDSPQLTFDDGHPIVQAALGGHPTYPNTCGNHPRPILNDLVSDWIVCGSGRYAFRAATTPLVDLSRTTWACWPGHFGEATPRMLANAKLPDYDPARAIAKYVLVAGPVSPLRQAENANVCTGH